MIRTQRRLLNLCAAAMLAAVGSAALRVIAQQHAYVPKNGFVPDEATAMRIAEAIWIPIYGKAVVDRERPFKAALNNGVWAVHGRAPSTAHGGAAEAEISKLNGAVLKVSHGK